MTRGSIHPDIRMEGIMFSKLFHFESPKSFKRAQSMLMKMKRFMKPSNLRAEEQIVKVEGEPPLRLCVYRAPTTKPDAVGLLWLHGGGYAIGLPEQELPYIQNFAAAANCVVVAPDYRLSVQEPYPAAVNDCYNALVWLRKNAEKLGVREDQLFIGGNSAGGGLAVAVALMARDKGEISLAYQMPFYPMLDDRMLTQSAQNNDAPVWDSKANETAWKMYLGKLYNTGEVPKYAAPSRETNYQNLPPAYMFVGGIEPFLDETMEYVENLKKAGVPAEIDIYPGCYHGFNIACKKSTVAKQATERYIEKFKYAVENYFQPQNP